MRNIRDDAAALSVMLDREYRDGTRWYLGWAYIRYDERLQKVHVHIREALYNLRANTLEKVAELTEGQLLEQPGIGPGYVKRIRKLLCEHGLKPAFSDEGAMI